MNHPGRRDAFSLLTAALTAAILALALGTLTGPAVVTTAGTDPDRSSTGPVAASMPEHAVRPPAVGIEGDRTLVVGRAVGGAGPRSVVPAVVGLAAGAACVGLRRRPGRRTLDGLVPCVLPPWALSGRRRAPPLASTR